MRKDSQRGFTIIEMLIVLAIAGLILSMILVVIPTVQRNGRNNQRKQDVQAILANVSHYALNNSGNFPSDSQNANSIKTGLKLSYYSLDKVEIQSRPALTSIDPTNPLDLDRVIVANRQKCAADNLGGATPNGAGYSDVVALYMIETGGGNTAKRCQEL